MVVTELGGVINGEDLPDNAIIDGVQEEGADYKTGKQFVKMGEKFINIENLNVDLISSVNPFQHAYEILSKAVTPEMLKTIQAVATATKIAMTEEEALMLWNRIQDFMRKHQQPPNIHSTDPLERRMAEAIIFLRNKKAEKMARGE